MKDYPKKGDRYTVNLLHDYKLIQDRPFACRDARGGCACGKCNGYTSTHPGTVREVIYYADNSVVAVVDCDDGKTRHVELMYPHGDLCF